MTIAYEALCERCGQHFNPTDENDLEHVADAAGEECGGRGVLLGSYGRPPVALVAPDQTLLIHLNVTLPAGTITDAEGDAMAYAEALLGRHLSEYLTSAEVI